MELLPLKILIFRDPLACKLEAHHGMTAIALQLSLRAFTSIILGKMEKKVVLLK